MTSADAKRRISDWFHKWRLPLRRFLGRAGVPAADVEDIAQEVFLRLMRYDRTELIDSPQAYLYKVASNVAAEWSIRARNRHPHDEKWLVTLVDQRAADLPLVVMQSRQEVERALNTLSPHQREILKLFFADGLRYAEIASHLGESLRSVRREFERSYDKLRHELDPELLGEITHGRD